MKNLGDILKKKVKLKLVKENINLLDFETQSKENKKTITFSYDNTKYFIKILDEVILFKRENNDFIHSFEFILNKKSTSTYLIKENNYYLDVEIFTNKILITEDTIEIVYIVIDSKEEIKLILKRW